MPVTRGVNWVARIAASVALFGDVEIARAQKSYDSRAHVRARAVRAQQQFESYRRRQLPVTYGRSGSSDCDVRIGRFCYWHDDLDRPPAEPARVAAARDVFLRALDSVSAIAPEDPWVVGQRVRYLLEAQRHGDALRVALGCSGAAWWCAALTGFAHHAAGAYSAADSMFERALAAMPLEQRCRWTDLRDVLPDGFTKAYRAVPCERRDSINAQVWWLADPRWSLGGNDLRSEIYSRLTMAELVRQARSAHDMSWGDDMAELMLRYGWPTSWSRTAASMSDPTRVNVVGHEPSPSFEFMPAADALRDPWGAELDSWTPLEPRPITRYAPAYAKHFRELAPQVAWFRRGDSAVVVVGYDARRERDTVFTRDIVEAAVVLSRGPQDAAIARARAGPRHGAVVLPAARSQAMVSIEVTDSAARAFARGRAAVRPAVDSSVSDLLLFDAGTGLPETFEDAAERALGALTVSRGAPFGIYWELYGAIAEATDVTYAVSVERVSANALRRFAERVRLAQPVRPVRMSFDAARPSASRSLLVDVSHIPPGRYRLTLQVLMTGSAAATTREIEVR